MPADILKCHDCHMNFRTDSQLRRHKDKFCIGAAGPRESNTEQVKSSGYGNDIARDRIKQLEDLKARKSRLQELQDEEERGLLKSLKKMDQTSQSISRRTPDINQIQDQIKKYSSLQDIQRHQKDVINRRLGDLENQGRAREAERIEQLNRTIHEQDRRNQRAIEDLKNELRDLLKQEKTQPPPQPPPAQPSAPPAVKVPPSLPPTEPGQSLEAVLGDIAAQRRQYIAAGGNDPRILAQMTEMMTEAMNLEKMKHKYRKRRRERVKEQPNYDDSRDNELRAIERENNRLQAQLLQMQQMQQLQQMQPPFLYGQQQPAPYRDTRSPTTQELEREQRRRELDHHRKIQEIQQEMDLLKQQQMLQKFRKDLGLDSDVRNNSRASSRANKDNHHGRSGREQPPVPYTEVPTLMQTQQFRNSFAGDPLQPAPYDPNLGFYVFLDFVSGLEANVTAVRLIAGLYSNLHEVGEPAVLPLAKTETVSGNLTIGPETLAVIGAKQPIPKCLPNPNLALVIEMQIVDGNSLSLKSRAWTKINLFDEQNRLVSGRWKCILRVLPIRPHMDTADLNTTPQYGNAMLNLRLVNARDADAQGMMQLTPTNAHLYQFPPEGFKHQGPVNINDPSHLANYGQLPPPPPPPPSAPPPSLSNVRDLDSPIINSNEASNRYGDSNELDGINSERTIGFQVDRVKNAEPGIGKVRMTAYYAHNGDVVQSSTSPVTCSTSAVKSSFKVGYHIFGQQEATFYDVDFRPDMVIIVRFYLQKRSNYRIDGQEDEETDAAAQGDDLRVYDDEELAAWAAMPLMVPARGSGPAIRQGRLLVPHLKNMRVNTGTHILPLFLPPVIDPDRIPFEAHWTPKGWQRYGQASVKVHVFHPRPRPGSLTPSPHHTDDEGDPPAASWLPLERRRAPIEPFYASDGFDVYIDGCRFLPDAVTVTRVRGRILTRKYEPIGKEISCMSTLDSDIFNPKFNHRQEFREPNIPPSSTLLLKLYTLDRFTQKLKLVGYASLNVFVDIGSNNQPTTDQGGVQMSLNDGAHQCRIYAEGPNGVDALTEGWMRNRKIRPILGASILVRLSKAPMSSDGKPLTTEKVPKSDWYRLGLVEQMPSYSDRIYYSMTCRPSLGESKILRAHIQRPAIEVREIIPQLADKEMKTMSEIEKYSNSQLSRKFDGEYSKYNLNYISQYVPQQGFKFALDGAVNLPWHNFTLAHMCLNPPGAFYLGKPHAAYDRLVFTETLDLASTNRSPIWQDGWREYRSRAYHRHMTLIIHLQEIAVTATKDNYKYGLLDQAWTAVPIFENGFTFTDTFQMPLFAGPPSRELLQAMTRIGFTEVMANAVEAGTLRILDGAAIIVRLCDARREEELTASKDNEIIYLNQDYIPKQLLINYQKELEGRILHTMIPQGKNPSAFVAALVNKFKSLVYKLYEENKIFPTIPPEPEDPRPEINQ